MKQKYLFATLLITFFILSSTTDAAHHEKEENNNEEGQQAVLDAFGWDFSKAKITTEKITENIHVLFGYGGNILVSTGKDGVLLVDDQFPQLKYKIMSAIRKLGGRSVDYIVNTHWHFDHAEGNNAFGPDGASIVAHENSRELMLNPKPINLSFLPCVAASVKTFVVS